MKLSVIMPVYNERATIAEIVRRVLAVRLPKELIIVDDGSTDGTRELLMQIPPEVATVLYHGRNQGKGAAIRTGLEHVSGEIVIIQDADLEYDPNDYLALVRPIVEGTARVVYGSRTLRPDNSFSRLRFYLGVALSQQGRLAEAQAALAKAAELASTFKPVASRTGKEGQ